MTRSFPVILIATCLLAGTPADAANLKLGGLVARPLSLSLNALRGYPLTHVAVTQASGHGARPLDCRGVAVATLLEDAKPRYGAAKNARLAHTLLFTAGDGYQAALAVAETDAWPGHAPPILAIACNGRNLDAPRLIVPGDAEAGRAVNNVVSVEVRK
jgi:DMSO/TMAO reductase YedYZ molybdopterin-dependent catalytic subunit